MLLEQPVQRVTQGIQVQRELQERQEQLERQVIRVFKE